MVRIDTITKEWREAGSLPAQINLYGFWDEHAFLTKSGDLGSVLKIGGIDYESLDHAGRDYAVNLLAALVHSAGIEDRVGARAVLMRLFCRFDTVVKVFADGGYTGTLIDWAKAMFGYDVEVVKRNEMHTFKVLPKRWIVERNFAWMGWSRRLSKDYELCPTSAETMILISFAHTLLKRFA